jgi:hypothetical protein
MLTFMECAQAETARIFLGPVVTNVELGKEVNDEIIDFMKYSGNDMGDKVIVSDNNPVCCFYIMMHRPSPSTDGFVIIHQGGGTLMIASSEKQIEAGIISMKKGMILVNGKPQFPIGVISGY